MNITELKRQEASLKLELEENHRLQRELSGAEFIKKYGFEIGDKVEWIDGGKTKSGIIDGIDFNLCVASFYFIRIINSDGKPGNRVTRAWPWMLITMKKVV